MKIDTKPDVQPIKKRPYKLAHKYKEIVKKEIDNMLASRHHLPYRPIRMGKSNGCSTKETRSNQAKDLC